MLISRTHVDDLRCGALIYTILERTTWQQNIPAESASLYNLVLPRINEIKCVDDTNTSNSSYICWRYARRRALTSVKILPLPFVGIASHSTPPKFYLEWYNECTKRFVVLREFHIDEGMPTSLELDSPHAGVVVHSKIWRIRLSKEAQKIIYASSLVASTKVDSLELSCVSIRTSTHFWSHVEINLSNLDVKINMLGPNLSYSDLLVLTLSQFASRAFVDRVADESTEVRKRMLSLKIFALGQLQADYCEYRFITMRPVLESLQFKTTIEYNSNVSEINVRTEVDALNILTSQSALICMRQLEKEWLDEKQVFLNIYS